MDPARRRAPLRRYDNAARNPDRWDRTAPLLLVDATLARTRWIGEGGAAQEGRFPLSPEPAILNLKILAEFLGDGDAMPLRTYLDLFRRTIADDLVPRLVAAAETDTPEQLFYLAHCLKGLASHAGAELMVTASQALEQAARGAVSTDARQAAASELARVAALTLAAVDTALVDA